MSLTSEDKQWIQDQLQVLATGLKQFATLEDLERVETRLLTEFHKWASPLEARLRTHAATLRALDMEMESLDDRIKKIEGRTPPPS